jgi:hypothetical protein
VPCVFSFALRDLSMVNSMKMSHFRAGSIDISNSPGSPKTTLATLEFGFFKLHFCSKSSWVPHDLFL